MMVLVTYIAWPYRYPRDVHRAKGVHRGECVDVFLQPPSRPGDGGHMPGHCAVTVPPPTVHGKWRLENILEKQT